MKRKIFGVGFVLLIALFAGCGASAQVSAEETAVREATVSGFVTDTQGDGLIAQLVITGEDYLARINTDMLGRFAVTLPLGSYAVEITKGSEYERKAMTVEVTDRKAKYLGGVPLKKLYDTDWIAGDLHQHSVYSFDGTDSPADILLSDLSAGMGFGVVTDHNEVRANAEFLSAQLDGFIPVAGIEITTDKGHFNAINFDRVVDSDVSGGAADIERIVGAVRESADALLQINHPLRDGFTFDDWDLVRRFDIMEVWNGKSMPPYVDGEPNNLTLKKWYEMLNDGLYLPATGGSDNHDIGGNRMFFAEEYKSDDERWFMTSMYSGAPRNYVLTKTTGAQGVLDALRSGNSFITNNPLAFLDVDDAIPGEASAAGEKNIHVRIQSNRGLISYRLVKNGEPLHEEEITGLTAENTVTAALQAGDWVVLEVRGENGDYALTNPVFID